jgi:Ser/Thr protein kinase RdoA (MazF antagonist)
LGELCRRYGLGGSPTVRRLTGGYANDLFRVDCVGEAPVVLHIKNPPSSAESMDWEHRQVRALSIDLPEALPPRPALALLPGRVSRRPGHRRLLELPLPAVASTPLNSTPGDH